MTRRYWFYGILGTFVFAFMVGFFGTPETFAAPESKKVIIAFDRKPGPNEEALIKAAGGEINYTYDIIPAIATSLPEAALNGILRNPHVVRVEEDIVMRAFAQTLPSGVNRIEAEFNLTAKINGIDEIDNRVDVDIAIIDTGIDADHPDLNVVDGVRFYTRGSSFTDSNYNDDNGHGTHVAGTAASIDNDFGVVGVAPGARLWAVKVLNSSGSGYLSDIIAGIQWVTNRAAYIEVVNMSLGGQGKSDSYRLAIQNSVKAGIVYVVAAGNSKSDVYGPDGVFNTSDDFIPAAYPEVATISAMDDYDGYVGPNDKFASSYSNYSSSVVTGNPVTSPGAAIDLMLPGSYIYSTYLNGGYSTMSGTSMASPHAAGLVALYIAENGRATDAARVYAIRQALIDNGKSQEGLYGLSAPNDPEEFKENIGWAVGIVVDSPPDVSWFNPIGNASASGIVPIQIKAKADADPLDVADEGISKVDWRMEADTVWRSTVANTTTGYYEASWNTSSLVNGSCTLYAMATDNTGHSKVTSIIVNVSNTPSLQTMSVRSIVMSLSSRKVRNNTYTKANAAVTVLSASKVPLTAATVKGHWSGLTSDSGVFTTGTDGIGSCTSKEVKNASGTFTFIVDDVILSGWSYDNTIVESVTSASITTSTSTSKSVAISNFPNPANPHTSIQFSLDATSPVTLKIYNVTGQLVRTLADQSFGTGIHTVVWNGMDEQGRMLSSGNYFCRLFAGDQAATLNFSLLK